MLEIVSVASIGVTLAVGVLASWYFFAKSRATDLPPYAKEGFFRALSKFLGPTAHLWLLDTSKEFNSKIFRLPLTPPGFHFVVVTDASVARTILMDPTTMKFLPFYRNFEKFTGSPIIGSTEGFRYKHARKAIMPAFGSNSIERMSRCISQVIDKWVETKLETAIQNDDSLDIHDEMQRITAQIISEVGFEYTLSEYQLTTIIAAFRVLMKEYLNDNMLNPLREYLWFFYPHAKAARKARTYCADLMRSILEAHRAKGDKATPGIIVDIIDKNPDYVNDNDRVGDLGLFIGAGFETTAGTLSWTLYLLAKDDVHQSKLREALRPVSEEEAIHHPMLRNTIREAMRLYPPAAAGGPRCIPKDIHHDGLRIPKGSIVLIPPYPIHRDPDYFDNPNEFLPSR